MNPSQEKRCEYCANGEKHEAGAIYPCHERASWMEELRQLIAPFNCASLVIPFISALLISEREKMAKEVEGLRVNKVLCCSNPACGKENHPCQNPVYNKAIEVIAALIRTKQ